MNGLSDCAPVTRNCIELVHVRLDDSFAGAGVVSGGLDKLAGIFGLHLQDAVSFYLIAVYQIID
ncbi:hypothetical protein D3C87_1613520 [compost metagenome]